MSKGIGNKEALPSPREVWKAIYNLSVMAGFYQGEYENLKVASNHSLDQLNVLQAMKELVKRSKDSNFESANHSEGLVRQVVGFLCNMYAAELTPIQQKEALVDHLGPYLKGDLTFDEFVLPASRRGRKNILNGSQRGQRGKAEELTGRLLNIGGRRDVARILNKTCVPLRIAQPTTVLKIDSALLAAGNIKMVFEKLEAEVSQLMSHTDARLNATGKFGYLVPEFDHRMFVKVKRKSGATLVRSHPK